MLQTGSHHLSDWSLMINSEGYKTPNHSSLEISDEYSITARFA